MPHSWTCIEKPNEHGAFLQSGLFLLAKKFPALQPRARFGCPRCMVERKQGWMRPATETEAACLSQPMEH